MIHELRKYGLISATLLMIGCGTSTSSKTANIAVDFQQDYVLTVMGTEGHSEVFMTPNSDNVTAAITSVEDQIEDAKANGHSSDIDALEEIKNVLQNGCKFDGDSSALKNGDKVTFNCNVESSEAEKYGITYKNIQPEFEVSGLQELIEIDDYTNLKVVSYVQGMTAGETSSILMVSNKNGIMYDYKVEGGLYGIEYRTYGSYYVEKDYGIYIEPLKKKVELEEEGYKLLNADTDDDYNRIKYTGEIYSGTHFPNANIDDFDTTVAKADELMSPLMEKFMNEIDHTITYKGTDYTVDGYEFVINPAGEGEEIDTFYIVLHSSQIGKNLKLIPITKPLPLIVDNDGNYTMPIDVDKWMPETIHDMWWTDEGDSLESEFGIDFAFMLKE